MPTQLVDAAGRTHRPAGPDARIVSLVPSITELLFDLGLGPQVVGRTTFCIHPQPEVDTVPRVGGTKSVAFDRLAAAAPTHIIVNIDENLRDDMPRLEATGASVVVTHPLVVEDNLSLYALLGGLFGQGARADALASALRDGVARARALRASRPTERVLYLIWRDPWMTVTSATYVADMLALAGMSTIAPNDGTRYPVVPPEHPVWHEADRILLSSEPFPFRERHVAEVRALAGEQTPIDFIDGEMTSWYGSRAVTGVRYLTEWQRQ